MSGISSHMHTHRLLQKRVEDCCVKRLETNLEMRSCSGERERKDELVRDINEL